MQILPEEDLNIKGIITISKMRKCCDMRGFLSFQVLNLISKKEMSGQDISEEIMKRRGKRPSPGTIYPVLRNLNESGFIEEVKDCGKEKKYSLAKSGRKEFHAATTKFCEIFYDMREEFDRCRR